ncbi:hypothetical protein IWW55_001561 [Coemansia sp. RSA 2706]|nr:hypothetical protein IWW55_001561 [Coemansia sp. RSA 2706]KAJ2320128.1 hypothetical protein IWW52_001552 [Coemansia sp. RSA 2704]KAJ2328006.1 hypothetical protein IWW51_001430 [Coemansia sp. RSA 2702]KAJ2738037.1 hypothetical protein H4R23_001428 [Coemansia sp. Cherry 401B]
MAGTTKCNRPCCANEISALQPHVQSHPKQAHGMPPALMPAAHGDHCASESAEAAVFVPGRNAGFDTLDIPHVNLYQSRLLNSISECLKEDAALSHSNSDSTDDLNISMLFDEPDTGCELAFNIHNCSQETLSAFDSSFFASQDIPAARCPGDITVSDFGNSRYGLALDNSQMPVWTARSADSMASVDTLPEYVHQGELPPPYPFMAFTPHAMGTDPIYDTRRASRSRANVCLSAYSGGQWSRSFSHRNDSINAMRNPSMFGSRAMMDSYDPIDFRPFPRHMC